MKPSVKEWLEYAEKDLRAAEILISDSAVAAVACFIVSNAPRNA